MCSIQIALPYKEFSFINLPVILICISLIVLVSPEVTVIFEVIGLQTATTVLLVDTTVKLVVIIVVGMIKP